ncbi:MAG: helix-turn-helix domain-containing protein [Nitrospira sp.]|nr:helix-turn-helix domain-containing protein [Nitrospira sp.]
MSTAVARAERNDTIWRERVARQAASGKTIAVFCREEGIGQSTLSYWRKRLGVVGGAAVAKRFAMSAPFLDAGPVSVVKSPPHGLFAQGDAPNRSAARIELRLDLGEGMTLYIARR